MPTIDFKQSRYAILGCGSLGESMLRGLLQQSLAPQNIVATSRRLERCQELTEIYGIASHSDNIIATQQADVIILAAKPMQFSALCANVKHVLRADQLFISVAAGLEVAQIRTWLNSNCSLVRAMPNTPSALGLAATGLFADAHVSSDQRRLTEQIFTAIGRWTWLPEERWMNWVTALAGCGPAYFFQMMQHMVDAAVAAGFPADCADLLVRQTALGAGALATQNDAPALNELVRRVRSPGGTTEAALNALAARDFAGIMHNALMAAELRGRELSEMNKTS